MEEGRLFLKYISEMAENLKNSLVYNPTYMGKDGTDILRGKIMNMEEIASLPKLLSLRAQEEVAALLKKKKEEGV